MTWLYDFFRGWWPPALRRQIEIERGYRRAAECKVSRLEREEHAWRKEAARWETICEHMRRDAGK